MQNFNREILKVNTDNSRDADLICYKSIMTFCLLFSPLGGRNAIPKNSCSDVLVTCLFLSSHKDARNILQP